MIQNTILNRRIRKKTLSDGDNTPKELGLGARGRLTDRGDRRRNLTGKNVDKLHGIRETDNLRVTTQAKRELLL